MTTIAADMKQMASDSKVSLDGGMSYPTDKIKKVKKMLVGAGGNGGDCSRFLDWAAREFKDPVPKWSREAEDEGESFLALVLRSDGLYVFAPSFPEPEKINLPFYAIGTGANAARVAMMLGKTPKEAIELACQVDEYSGPPVQVLEL